MKSFCMFGWLLVVMLVSFSYSSGYAMEMAVMATPETLATPVIPEALKQEAALRQKEGLSLKKEYSKDARARSDEVKDALGLAIRETMKETSPCLSGPTHPAPQKGGRCSVKGLGLDHLGLHPLGLHSLGLHKEGKDQPLKTPSLEGFASGGFASKGPASKGPASNSITPNDSPPDDRILVFVSFSMPKDSIAHLIDSLKDNPNVTLVLRGLIDESMEKTVKYIADIKGVFEINPERFDLYDIQVVPTFVLLKKDIPVARVQGNITLTYAKELFAEAINGAIKGASTGISTGMTEVSRGLSHG